MLKSNISDYLLCSSQCVKYFSSTDRISWTTRRSNQSILKEISPGCSLEGLMLKLKLQYFGHLMWRTNSLEKTLMLGKIEGRRKAYGRGWDGWMASWIQWTWVWVNPGVSDDRVAWNAAVHGVTKSQTRLSNWTELTWTTLDVTILISQMRKLWQREDK